MLMPKGGNTALAQTDLGDILERHGEVVKKNGNEVVGFNVG